MPEISEVRVHPGETNAKITGMNNEDTVYGEGTITYDIRFQAMYPKSGEHIKIFVNVEAQKDFYPGYPIVTRGIFYGCRMILAQYATEFTEPAYGDMKKVFSIWICLNPSKKAGNTIARYSIKKEDLVGVTEDRPEDYDKISVIMICLGGKNLDNYGGILKMLDVLLSESRTPDEKKEILEEEYEIAMSQEFKKEVHIMCNLSQGVRERAILEGIEQGIEQGIEKKEQLLIKKFSGKGTPPEEIADLLDIDISYVRNIQRLLIEHPEQFEDESIKS